MRPRGPRSHPARRGALLPCLGPSQVGSEPICPARRVGYQWTQFPCRVVRAVICRATLFDESAPFLSPGYAVPVHDISLAGIGFRIDRQLPIGSTHRIHLATKEVRVISRVSVKRCKKGKNKGEYEPGCEFIED